MAPFAHRKFEVYRATIELIGMVGRTTAGFPPGFFPLRTQALRAACSIALNIGEGAGEYAPKEKARFYRMARRSATETVTAFDAMHVLGLIGPEAVQEATHSLERIAAMLTRMSRKMERTRRPPVAPAPPAQ